jgi:hypothetical protein
VVAKLDAGKMAVCFLRVGLMWMSGSCWRVLGVVQAEEAQRALEREELEAHEAQEQLKKEDSEATLARKRAEHGDANIFRVQFLAKRAEKNAAAQRRLTAGAHHRSIDCWVTAVLRGLGFRPPTATPNMHHSRPRSIDGGDRFFPAASAP